MGGSRLAARLVAITLILIAERALAGPPFVTTLIVPATGTAAQNGAALAQAIDAATTGPIKRQVIKLEAANYRIDLPIVLPDLVDIEGSGRQRTIIETSFAANPAVLCEAGVRSELRDLTILNLPSPAAGAGTAAVGLRGSGCRVTRANIGAGQGPGSVTGIVVVGAGATPFIADVALVVNNDFGGTNTGIVIQNGASPKLSDVSITATSTAAPNRGLLLGDGAGLEGERLVLAIDGGSPGVGVYGLGPGLGSIAIRNSSITVTGESPGGPPSTTRGLWLLGGGSVTLSHSQLSAAGDGIGALVAGAAELFVRHSTIAGTTASIRNESSGEVRVADSRLKGATSKIAASSFECYAVSNTALAALGTDCK